MQGFIGENTLRNKAALIGRTVLRQTEQVIIPDITFVCSGTLSQWRFVAQRNGVGGRRNRYPELQIWRPQNSRRFSKVYSETLTPQTTDYSNVYIHTLSNTFTYQAGDVFGIHYPPSDVSVFRLYSIQSGGPTNYRIERRTSLTTEFNLDTSTVKTDLKDYPLVGIETSQ